MPRIFDDGKVEKAIKELEKVREEWLKHPEVEAVDVGYRIREETRHRDDELAIRVHVRRKRPFEALREDERFNNRVKQKFLGESPKFPIDVVEAAYQPNESRGAVIEAGGEPREINRRRKVDPLVGGISISCHRGGFGGTLGAIVYDCTDGQPCILTNWHVLAGSHEREKKGSIIQPGIRHGGLLSRHKVGKVRRCVLDKHIDAGLAELLVEEESKRNYSLDIMGLESIEGVEKPKLGMEVVKSASESGVTKGMIDGISASLKITYDSGRKHILYNDPHKG